MPCPSRVGYRQPIIERYGIAATVVSDVVDSTFHFITADWDGRIRMDCSSPYAMTRLVDLRGTFDVGFANDTDADRYGIVAGVRKRQSPAYARHGHLNSFQSCFPARRRSMISALIDSVADSPKGMAADVALLLVWLK